LLTPFLKSCAPEFLPGLFVNWGRRAGIGISAFYGKTKYIIMRTLFSVLFLASGMMILQACNDSGKTNENNSDSTSMGDTTSNMVDTSNVTNANSGPLSKDDSTFMVTAADGGMMEVELGQVALQNAANDRVKNFGNMMVNDHTAAGNDLKQLAARKNINLPPALSDKHLKHKNDMSKKKGKDFDKAYIKMMVSDHEEDIKEFEKAATGAQDADVRAFANKTLPTLRIHLDSAKAISQSIK
jgi:putative membrane protein